MPDEIFTAAAGDDHGPRVLWSGHCAVAEYAFEEPNSLPRWTLPEETEVIITDDRVVYRDVATGAAGELHFPWPQHLRVQPGNRATGRAATVTQIQLVCAGPGGTYPALVFAGGDLATVGDADRLANVLRQAIARYRVEHAPELGVPAEQVRMLSRLVIGPEFANYQGGEGQTVTMLGSITVDWPTGSAPEPLVEEPFLDEYLPDQGWPTAGGAELDAVDAAPQPRPTFDPTAPPQPRPADDATLRGTPDLAERAADLAARVANLVSEGTDLGRYEPGTANLSSYLGGQPRRSYGMDGPTEDRAEKIRRTAARLATNSARGRTVLPRRGDDEPAHRRP